MRFGEGSGLKRKGCPRFLPGQAETVDFQLTFLGVAVIAAIALLDNLRLPPQAGESVLQREEAKD